VLRDEDAVMRRYTLGVALACALVLPAGCADHLPDQDLRITTAAPAAKLPADELWKDFQKDPVAARRQYFGTAVDISGTVAAVQPDAGGVPVVFFSQPDLHGVRARLLDERGVETMKSLTIGSRTTLRCFCEGFTPEQDLLLKSCIRP
jgi:hypothetical protein